MTEKWEYLTEFLFPGDDKSRAYVKQQYPNWKAPEYAVEGTMLRLNELGEQGWELVHMQPVALDRDYSTTQMNRSYHYFCVLKRRKI